MKKFIASELLYRVLRIVIGGLFIYAGVIKMSDPGAFAETIDGYGLVSWRMTTLLAKTLPILEIVSGLGLVLNIKGALGMIVAQLLGFMVVIAYAIHLGLNVDCGCFGPSDSAGAEGGGLWQTFYRDMLMFGVCLLMYWQRRTAGLGLRSFIPLKFQRNKD